MSDATRESFLKTHPHRVAFKHAHSRQNVDSTWGRDVLRSIEFAFFALNQRYGSTQRLSKDNTLVIVTGNSNGGGAALLAAEQDRDGLIDGVVAAQPQVQPEASDQVVIERLGRQWRGGGRSLVDYFTETILYQPCAAMATPSRDSRQPAVRRTGGRLQRVLKSALVGESMARANAYQKRFLNAAIWPDRRWKISLGFDPGAEPEFSAPLDEYASWFYEAVTAATAMATTVPGVGQTYLEATKDRDGNWLDGGKAYRLHVDAHVPGKQFAEQRCCTLEPVAGDSTFLTGERPLVAGTTSSWSRQEADRQLGETVCQGQLTEAPT